MSLIEDLFEVLPKVKELISEEEMYSDLRDFAEELKKAPSRSC